MKFRFCILILLFINASSIYSSSLSNDSVVVCSILEQNNLSIEDWRSYTDIRTDRVQYLGMTNCGIFVLPNCIGQLDSLKGLNIHSNALTYLPDSIGYLSELGYLNLMSNMLTSLPASISELHKLSTLSVGNNQLNTFIDCSRLTNLSSVDIQNNALTALDVDFSNTSSLGILYANNNKIQRLACLFNPMKDITIIDFSNNLIESITDSTFATLGRVAEFDLSYNNLITLPVSFGDLNVWDLNLSHNQLTELPAAIGNIPIDKLNLSYNALTDLPLEIMQHDDFCDFYTNVEGRPQYSYDLSLAGNKLCNLSDTLWKWADRNAGSWWSSQVCDVPLSNKFGTDEEKPSDCGNCGTGTYLLVMIPFINAFNKKRQKKKLAQA